jgi:RimJ/RimL family protein N-acetyltransferase
MAGNQLDTPSPHLQSRRLELSPYGADDFRDVLRIMSDPRVIWWRSTPMTEDEVRIFFDRTRAEQAAGYGWWLMREQAGPLLGHAALKPLSSRPDWIEVGYHLLPEARGHGYATEAAHALLDYGFETCGLEVIYAVVLPDNAPSQAVMGRLGMPRVGMHRHADMEHDLFRLRRTEWLALGRKSAHR